MTPEQIGDLWVEVDDETADKLRETARRIWTVERHGGTTQDSAREIYRGDELIARGHYDKIKEALRQGTVVLKCDGQQIAACGAPRLRTRW